MPSKNLGEFTPYEEDNTRIINPNQKYDKGTRCTVRGSDCGITEVNSYQVFTNIEEKASE